MWKVSSTEEQTRDGRRISEPSVSLISFDMQSYSLGKPMGGSAHMKINRKSARQAGNHDDSQADWQKEEHTCKHTAAKLICKQIIKQARSSERHRNPRDFFGWRWQYFHLSVPLCRSTVIMMNGQSLSKEKSQKKVLFCSFWSIWTHRTFAMMELSWLSDSF